MSTTTLDPADTAGVFASIRRIIGEGVSPTMADGKALTVSMMAMDSTQRAVADEARVLADRREATERLQAMSDEAFARRNEHYRTSHRDSSPAHTGNLAPIGVAADPSLNAAHLSKVASMARSDAETGHEAAIAAERMREASAAHEAALAERKERLANGWKRGAQ